MRLAIFAGVAIFLLIAFLIVRGIIRRSRSDPESSAAPPAWVCRAATAACAGPGAAPGRGPGTDAAPVGRA
jgi:hypothetical protein